MPGRQMKLKLIGRSVQPRNVKTHKRSRTIARSWGSGIRKRGRRGNIPKILGWTENQKNGRLFGKRGAQFQTENKNKFPVPKKNRHFWKRQWKLSQWGNVEGGGKQGQWGGKNRRKFNVQVVDMGQEITIVILKARDILSR